MVLRTFHQLFDHGLKLRLSLMYDPEVLHNGVANFCVFGHRTSQHHPVAMPCQIPLSFESFPVTSLVATVLILQGSLHGADARCAALHGA